MLLFRVGDICVCLSLGMAPSLFPDIRYTCTRRSLCETRLAEGRNLTDFLDVEAAISLGET